MAMNIYETGTVSVSDGGTVVSLTGGYWIKATARRLDTISIDCAPPVDIADVDYDAGQLTLFLPWAGGDKVDVPYKILMKSPLRFAVASAMEDAARIVAALNTRGFYVVVPNDATEPDPSLGNEGQPAIRFIDWWTWQKTGGVWVSRGRPAGLDPAANLADVADKQASLSNLTENSWNVDLNKNGDGERSTIVRLHSTGAPGALADGSASIERLGGADGDLIVRLLGTGAIRFLADRVVFDQGGIIQLGSGAGLKCLLRYDGKISFDAGVSWQTIWHDGNVTSLQEANGWRMTPDGIIENWGVFYADGTSDWNFPMSYPNAHLSSSAVLIGHPGPGSIHGVTTDSATKEKISVQPRYANSGGAGTVFPSWVMMLSKGK